MKWNEMSITENSRMEIKRTLSTIIYIWDILYYICSRYSWLYAYIIYQQIRIKKGFIHCRKMKVYIYYTWRINKYTDHMSTNIRRWAYLYCLIYFIHLDPLMYSFALIYIEDQLLCVYGIIKCITYMTVINAVEPFFETIMNI